MSSSIALVEPTEPWRSFLREFDTCLTGQVELRCFGGFVVAQHYGLTMRDGSASILRRWPACLRSDVQARIRVETFSR